MRKVLTFRSYEIENDASGLPIRMLWRGDFVRVAPVHYLTCQRCGSSRMAAQHCFDCWWTPPPSEVQWRRVNHVAEEPTP